MAEGGTVGTPTDTPATLSKEQLFLSELLGQKPVTDIPGIEQVHATKLRGKGIRKVS